MTAPQPLLRVENLTKRYVSRRPFAAAKEFTALRGISFSIAQKTTLALAGESGSGKSTLALCLACLHRPSSGTISLDGQELTALDEQQLCQIRPQVQLVFQDPARSLNPRWTALDVVAEPLFVQNRQGRVDRERKVLELFDRVAIPRKATAKQIHEFSGGQKQRLALARALALVPKLLILDEALSALDCSMQAQMANLLLELQSQLDLTYLFITHDLSMAAYLADEIAVLQRGQLVESGAASQVLTSPAHEATRALLSATPRFAETSSTLVHV